MAQNLIDERQLVEVGSDNHRLAVAIEEAGPAAQQAGGPGELSGPTRQTMVPAASSGGRDQSWIIHAFAAFYLLVMTVAWFVGGKIGSSDYIAQAALVLTSIGLYHAPPPGKGNG